MVDKEKTRHKAMPLRPEVMPSPPKPGHPQTPNVNWIGTLDNFSLIGGSLAGFTLAFVVFIFGWKVASDPFPLDPAITWGDVSVFLNGFSAVVFIAAAEFLTIAKQYNIWGLPKDYTDRLANWTEIQKKAPAIMLRYEEIGRRCYNLALFLMFFAFLFVIWPYNWAIALFVFASAMVLQVFQMTAGKRTTK
jgi:hypothetical protein